MVKSSCSQSIEFIIFIEFTALTNYKVCSNYVIRTHYYKHPVHSHPVTMVQCESVKMSGKKRENLLFMPI